MALEGSWQTLPVPAEKAAIAIPIYKGMKLSHETLAEFPPSE
jgi:hypothetical protein